MRFILNLVIATIFIIIGVHAESIWYVWLTAVWLLLGGLMYLFASFRGNLPCSGCARPWSFVL